MKEGSAKESGVRRRPMTRLLAARFTTNLRNKLQRRGASSKKAHSIGMKTFKLNKEVMIDDHLLLRVLNPRLLQKRTTRRELRTEPTRNARHVTTSRRMAATWGRGLSILYRLLYLKSDRVLGLPIVSTKEKISKRAN